MKKSLIMFLTLLFFAIFYQIQFADELSPEDSEALSTLDKIRTSFDMYAANNGSYPIEIGNSTDLFTAMGTDFPENINISGSIPGTLIGAVTNDIGSAYWIFAIGENETHCYGLTHDGRKAGPGTLSVIVSQLNSPALKQPATNNKNIIQENKNVEKQEKKPSKDIFEPMKESSGEIKILAPKNGEIFKPGDTVKVEMSVSNDSAMILLATSTGKSELLHQSPYTFEFVIPNEYIGKLSITAGARDDVGFIGSANVIINVSSTVKLVALKTEADSFDMGIGTQQPIYVYGSYDDGIERQISSSNEGTSFTSSDPKIVEVVEVIPAGMLKAKSIGKTVVTIENSGIKKEIKINTTKNSSNIVLDTPLGENIELSSMDDVVITFDKVSASGKTAVGYWTDNFMDIPKDLRRLTCYYNIATEVTFEGNIKLKIKYENNNLNNLDQKSNLGLFQRIDDVWKEITTSNDTENKIIYGKTNILTYTGSNFIIAYKKDQ